MLYHKSENRGYRSTSNSKRGQKAAEAESTAQYEERMKKLGERQKEYYKRIREAGQ